MLTSFCRLLVVAVAVTSHAAPSRGTASSATKPLVVAAFNAPPSSFKNADGEWTGIAVDLWRQVASDLHLTYEIKAVDARTQFRSADRKRFLPLRDLGIDVLLVTVADGDTEGSNEATAAYEMTGLGIAVRPESPFGFIDLLAKLFSGRVLKDLALLSFVFLMMGILVWHFERRRNPGEFGGPPARGLFRGVLWALEAMVGKAKVGLKSRWARLLTLMWAIVCTAFISGVTAKLASELTIHQLRGKISGPGDLAGVTVGVVGNSTGMVYASNRGLSFKLYPDYGHAMDAVASGQVDAVLGTAIVLKYFIEKDYPGRLVLLPALASNYGIAFALNVGDPLRHPINQSIFKIVESEDWKRVRASYFGNSN